MARNIEDLLEHFERLAAENETRTRKQSETLAQFDAENSEAAQRLADSFSNLEIQNARITEELRRIAKKRNAKALYNREAIDYRAGVPPREPPHEEIEREITDWAVEFERRAAESEAADNRNPPRKSYAPEKIGGASRAEAAKRAEMEPFATFRKMRNVASNPSWINGFNFGYSPSSPSTFFKQARIAVDLDDDYEHVAEFYSQLPSYQTMSDAQLRTYFTWRTQLRRGHIDPIALPYALLYCFEIINNVGVATPAEGLARLIEFWSAFRAHDERIDQPARRWAFDYFITSDFEEPFSVWNARFPVPFADASRDIKAMIADDYLDNLELLEQSSAYKITEGAFFRKGDRTRLDACVLSVLRSIERLFAAEGLDFRKVFVEKRTDYHSNLFANAIYLSRSNKENRAIEISFYDYIHINRQSIKRERYSLETYRAVVGFIMKTIDVRMRIAFGFPKALKPPLASQMKTAFQNSEFADALVRIEPWKKEAYNLLKRKVFTETIDAAITEFLAAEAQAEAARVDIDFSQLARIRAEHEETAEKLEIFDEVALSGEVGGEVLETAAADGVTTEVSDVEGATCTTADMDSTVETEVVAGAKVFEELSEVEVSSAAPEADEVAGISPVGAEVGAEISTFDAFENAESGFDSAEGTLALSEAERGFLAELLRGKASGGFEVELLIESINGKALEAIGDNLIDAVARTVYDEYSELAERLCEDD